VLRFYGQFSYAPHTFLAPNYQQPSAPIPAPYRACVRRLRPSDFPHASKRGTPMSTRTGFRPKPPSPLAFLPSRKTNGETEDSSPSGTRYGVQAMQFNRPSSAQATVVKADKDARPTAVHAENPYLLRVQTLVRTWVQEEWEAKEAVRAKMARNSGL